MRLTVLVAASLLAACQLQPPQHTAARQQGPTTILGDSRAAPLGADGAQAQPVADGEAGEPAEPVADQPVSSATYTNEEIVQAANEYFGGASENIALAVERIFSDYGRPNAYIIGKEGGGAAVVGLRYGHGTLTYKGGGSRPVWWQGPSVGWDFGGNAAKAFTLVYNLRNTYELFQRFPAVDGSLFIVAGVGVNYQRSGDITLAPMRTGVGLRAGASLGYVHYTREPSVVPF